jgi:hypothetical protein
MKQFTLGIYQGLIAFCIGAALVCAIVVATASTSVFDILFEAQRFAPFTEELCKFMAVCALVFYIQYAPISIFFLSSGFAVFESARHIQVYGVYGIWAMCAHITFGMAMMFFITEATRAQTKPSRYMHSILAIAVPVSMHFIYNLAIVPML